LIDRRLYLPKDWAEDPERRAGASVPEDVTFATKPKIGAAMVEAALQAGVPCAWVLGVSVYGSDKSLRVMLERREKPYVLCVRGNERLMVGDFHRHAAEDLAAGLSPINGGVCLPARVRKDPAFTTGLGSVCCGCKRRHGITGC
jgi:SRSO17 transposase